jgi:hypothetical protein
MLTLDTSIAAGRLRLVPQAAAQIDDDERSRACRFAFHLQQPLPTNFTVAPRTLLNSQKLAPLPPMSAQRLTRLPRLLSRRAFSISSRYATSFKPGPAPPRLPKEDQELFEKLQKASTGAFSTPRSDANPPVSTSKPDVRVHINQSPDSTSDSTPTPPQPSSQLSRPQINQSPDSTPAIRFENGDRIKGGEEFHPNMRRGAPPEFEGDTNPKTGEVGGPKNEPLRWGVSGDWSYNGRVTDF